MKRSHRRLASSGLAAPVLLAGCTSPAGTNLAPPRPRAASTGSAVPSTGPASTRPGRIRLHGRVALFSDRDHPGGDSDLYAMNPDGSAVTRLTRAGSEEQEPAFTPCKGACP
jgi:Tol biopolymer transport system component